MKLLEKDLIGMAEEVERLRAEVLNAEKRATAPIPYTGPYMNPDNLYPPAVHGTGGYAGSFGGPHLHTVGGAAVEGMNPYAVGGFAVGPPVISGPAVGAGAGGGAVAAGNPSWGVMYTMSHTQT